MVSVERFRVLLPYSVRPFIRPTRWATIESTVGGAPRHQWTPSSSAKVLTAARRGPEVAAEVLDLEVGWVSEQSLSDIRGQTRPVRPVLVQCKLVPMRGDASDEQHGTHSGLQPDGRGQLCKCSSESTRLPFERSKIRVIAVHVATQEGRSGDPISNSPSAGL